MRSPFLPSIRPDSLLVVTLLTTVVAIGPISTDLYLPSLPAIGTEFLATTGQVQLTLSAFMAGFAVAQLVYGPLSDRFGRRPVLIGGLLLYLAATALCTFATTIEALIAARFLQSLGACVGPVLGRAVARDIFGRERAAQVLSYMAMAMALAPALAPILGGYLQITLGWRANFGVLAVFAVIALAGIILILPETNRWRDPKATRPGRILTNYGALLRDRSYRGYLLIQAATFAGLFSFISGSSFVLIGRLELSPDAYGLSFATIVLGYIIGSFASARLTTRLGHDRMIMLGLCFTAAGGGLAAVLALAQIMTVATIVGPMFVFMIGCGMVLPNAMAGAIGPFPSMAGAASALMGFFQMASASAAGALVGQFSEGTGLAMNLALAASGGLGVIAYRRVLKGPPGSA